MTIARAHLVDPAVSRWYHCVTRCVRRAFLLGEGTEDRKLWIESRLEELAEIFAIKEPLARLANHQDKTRGAFFEGRFKSIAILDETALLATKLRQGTLLGRFFATSRQRLREVAERLGLRRVPNLGGCPAT